MKSEGQYKKGHVLRNASYPLTTTTFRLPSTTLIDMSDIEADKVIHALQRKQEQELEEMKRKLAERAAEKKRKEEEERKKAEEKERKRKEAEARKQKLAEKKAGSSVGDGKKRVRVEDAGKCDRCERLKKECVREDGACKTCTTDKRKCEFNGVGVREVKKLKKGKGKKKADEEEDEEEEDGDGSADAGAEEQEDKGEVWIRGSWKASAYLTQEAGYWRGYAVAEANFRREEEARTQAFREALLSEIVALKETLMGFEDRLVTIEELREEAERKKAEALIHKGQRKAKRMAAEEKEKEESSGKGSREASQTLKEGGADVNGSGADADGVGEGSGEGAGEGPGEGAVPSA